MTLLPKQTRPRQSLCLARPLLPNPGTTNRPQTSSQNCPVYGSRHSGCCRSGRNNTCVRECFVKPSHLLHTQGAGESLIPQPLHYCGPHSQSATAKMGKGGCSGPLQGHTTTTTHHPSTPTSSLKGPIPRTRYPHHERDGLERQPSKKANASTKKSHAHHRAATHTGARRRHALNRGGCCEAARPQQQQRLRRQSHCCCCWRMGAGGGWGAAAPHAASGE